MTKETMKEIHNTEYLDKKLPTIFYKKEVAKSISEGSNVIIEVSDKTSEAALVTFKKVRDMID